MDNTLKRDDNALTRSFEMLHLPYPPVASSLTSESVPTMKADFKIEPFRINTVWDKNKSEPTNKNDRSIHEAFEMLDLQYPSVTSLPNSQSFPSTRIFNGDFKIDSLQRDAFSNKKNLFESNNRLKFTLYNDDNKDDKLAMIPEATHIISKTNYPISKPYPKIFPPSKKSLKSSSVRALQLLNDSLSEGKRSWFEADALETNRISLKFAKTSDELDRNMQVSEAHVYAVASVAAKYHALLAVVDTLPNKANTLEAYQDEEKSMEEEKIGLTCVMSDSCSFPKRSGVSSSTYSDETFQLNSASKPKTANYDDGIECKQTDTCLVSLKEEVCGNTANTKTNKVNLSDDKKEADLVSVVNQKSFLVIPNIVMKRPKVLNFQSKDYCGKVSIQNNDLHKKSIKSKLKSMNQKTYPLEKETRKKAKDEPIRGKTRRVATAMAVIYHTPNEKKKETNDSS